MLVFKSNLVQLLVSYYIVVATSYGSLFGIHGFYKVIDFHQGSGIIPAVIVQSTQCYGLVANQGF